MPGLSFCQVVFASHNVVVDQSEGGKVSGIGTKIGIPHSGQPFFVQLFGDEFTNLLPGLRHLCVGAASHAFQQGMDGSDIVFLLGECLGSQLLCLAFGCVIECRCPYLCQQRQCQVDIAHRGMDAGQYELASIHEVGFWKLRLKLVQRADRLSIVLHSIERGAQQ